jgi:hypothetical protein
MRTRERRVGSAGLASLAALCLLLSAAAARGQAGEAKPLLKESFIHALEDGAKQRPRETARTYIKLVEKYGVAFKLTPADEARIRRAGGYLAAEGLELLLGALRDNYRPDPSAAMAELVEQNAALIQIIKATTDEGKRLTAGGGAAGSKEKLEALQNALLSFSTEVQNTLYNGSQPTLQRLQSQLEGGPPYDLELFYESIDVLAETSERQATKLSEAASTFALDPGYAALAKAIRQRAELFKRMPRFPGKATREQADEMRKALAQWGQINTQLEEAIRQLNAFILGLKP